MNHCSCCRGTVSESLQRVEGHSEATVTVDRESIYVVIELTIGFKQVEVPAVANQE